MAFARMATPRTSIVESSMGYWRLLSQPKIDLENGRAEYRGSLPEVLASFGVATNGRMVPNGQSIPPNPKGKATKMPRKQVSIITEGDPTHVTRLYHFGKRLLKPGRNLAMEHAPMTGKDAFFTDWNCRRGAPKGATGERNRDQI